MSSLLFLWNTLILDIILELTQAILCQAGTRRSVCLKVTPIIIVLRVNCVFSDLLTFIIRRKPSYENRVIVKLMHRIKVADSTFRAYKLIRTIWTRKRLNLYCPSNVVTYLYGIKSLSIESKKRFGATFGFSFGEFIL